MKQISGRAKFCVVDTNQHNQGASLCYTRHSVRILVTCVRTSRKIMLSVKLPPHPPLAQQAVQWVLVGIYNLRQRRRNREKTRTWTAALVAYGFEKYIQL